MLAKIEFQVWTSYRPPVGFEKRGHNEYYWLSKCCRWHVRQGIKGNMVLRDRTTDTVHIVAGKMPEVEAFVQELTK